MLQLDEKKEKKIGRYGGYGGAYIPELLTAPLEELRLKWESLKNNEAFLKSFHENLHNYAGRPTALTEVFLFFKERPGPRVFLKREDLLHTGAHKLNNALGQCLLAKELGKERVIAETGAGQHGVATATACARLGLDCVVYMGAEDIRRQEPNVKRMKLLGAEVNSVDTGSATLKDAINQAMRDWAFNYESSHYCLGSALGPHPYPEMVREFQKVIGIEAKEQIEKACGRGPDVVVACVGGGSNAIGIFTAFIQDTSVELVGVEAGGRGISIGEHAARFATGTPGVLHGSYTYLLQDENGQVLPTHSISAGLDYPAVGPEHVALYESGRAKYSSVTDKEAIEAFQMLSRTEGIIPAMESSHAIAYVLKSCGGMDKDSVVLVNLSGRGDKDLPELFSYLEKEGTGE
ncbi:MAG: tryptophan synthase beta chain [Chlamydiales bacterium]|jgi:tryptophan synthase beta chain